MIHPPVGDSPAECPPALRPRLFRLAQDLLDHLERLIGIPLHHRLHGLMTHGARGVRPGDPLQLAHHVGIQTSQTLDRLPLHVLGTIPLGQLEQLAQVLLTVAAGRGESGPSRQ